MSALAIVGTDWHAFVGDEFDCEGVLGHRDGPVCGQGRTAYIHRATTSPLMPGGESTSAMLRHVQADLAASQADLTKAERERDEALSYLGPLRESLQASAANAYTAMRERDEAVRRAADLEQMREELKQLRLLADGYLEDIQDLESGQDEVIDSLRSQRDLARAEVTTASKEVRLLRAARQWIVARDGGRYCERCEQEIRRGEAYELELSTGLLTHVRCPDDPSEGVPTMTDTTNPGGEGGSTPTESDEIEIKATTISTRTFRVDRAEYEQCLADGEVDDLFDVYVSDMNEQTTYTTPDGRIHAYPSGEVIGDESEPF